ncbi:MAG: site-specific DNA-methyltransferase, partial [Proteobacteria bacterium]
LLLCGDSRSADDFERLMGADKADMVATDPPYGVSYVGKTSDALAIQNDGKAGLEELLRDSLTLTLAHTRPGAVWYVAAPAGPQFLSFAIVLTELEVWRQTLVWVKNSLVMGHSDFHYRHEAIFYGWTPGAAHQQPADRKQDTIWECDRPSRSPDHPTMKPIKLYTRMIDHSSKPGDIVFEPFGGSGTTLLSCHQPILLIEKLSTSTTAVLVATRPNAVVVLFAVIVCVNVPGVVRPVPLTIVVPINLGVIMPPEIDAIV